MDLSIIILSYRSQEDLKRLLPTVFASEGIEFGPIGADVSRQYSAEVIVVDNGSPDGTWDFLQATSYNLKAIKNINNGFSKGNNLAIRQANGRYVLLLNPDTTVEKHTFKTMLDFMENRHEVGMATCKIIKPDGSLDRAARRNFPNPWNAMLRFLRLQKFSSKPYNLDDSTADQEMEIDSLVGAFLLTRKSLIDKIGLLDEDFFMYGEDIDWCWRCKEAGFKVWYYPKTSITHYKGESSKKIPFRALKWFHDAMWIFYRKHYKLQYPFIFNWLVWTGIYGRLIMLTFLNLIKGNRKVS
jgi:GT2 family glycosyltransferase